MTKSELRWGAGSLALGMLVGALLVYPFRSAKTVVSPVTTLPDAQEPTEATPAESDAFAKTETDTELMRNDASPPSLSEDAGPVSASDAGKARNAAHRAPHPVFREKDLLIHPALNERLCVDAPSRTRGLKLFPCHGHPNQRWTFVEDPSGASVVQGANETCLRAGKPTADGSTSVEYGACGSGALRLVHTGERKLEDARTGQCVTVRSSEKSALLILAPCAAQSGDQAWSLVR